MCHLFLDCPCIICHPLSLRIRGEFWRTCRHEPRTSLSAKSFHILSLRGITSESLPDRRFPSTRNLIHSARFRTSLPSLPQPHTFCSPSGLLELSTRRAKPFISVSRELEFWLCPLTRPSSLPSPSIEAYSPARSVQIQKALTRHGCDSELRA